MYLQNVRVQARPTAIEYTSQREKAIAKRQLVGRSLEPLVLPNMFSRRDPARGRVRPGEGMGLKTRAVGVAVVSRQRRWAADNNRSS